MVIQVGILRHMTSQQYGGANGEQLLFTSSTVKRAVNLHVHVSMFFRGNARGRFWIGSHKY